MIQKKFSLLGHICPLRQYPAPVVPVILINKKKYAVYLKSNYMTPKDDDILEPITDLKSLETYIAYDDDCININKLGLFNYKEDKLFAFDENIIESYKATEENTYFGKLLDDESFSGDNPFFRLSFAENIEDFEKIEKEVLRCCSDLQKYAPEFIPGWYENKIKQLSELYIRKITSGGRKKGYLSYRLNSSVDNPFGRVLLSEARGVRDSLEQEWEDYKKYLREHKPDWLQDEILEALEEKKEGAVPGVKRLKAEELESNTGLELTERLSLSPVRYQLTNQVGSSSLALHPQSLGIMGSSLIASPVTGLSVPILSALTILPTLIMAPSPMIMQKNRIF